jgi:hypothetical protein
MMTNGQLTAAIRGRTDNTIDKKTSNSKKQKIGNASTTKHRIELVYLEGFLFH